MIDIARDGRRGTGRYRKRERAYNVAAGADNSVQLKLLLAAAEVTKKNIMSRNNLCNKECVCCVLCIRQQQQDSPLRRVTIAYLTIFIQIY